MKKIFIILAITFGCILNLGGVKAALRGDVNGDGKVDRNDYTLLFRFTSSASVQGEGLNSKEKQLVKKNGDVNGDGSINDQDSEELMVLIRIDEDSQTYKNLNKETVSCGSGMISGVPSSIPKAVNIVYTALQIVVPIIIVIFGMIDLGKAVIASKEDEVKKARQAEEFRLKEEEKRKQEQEKQLQQQKEEEEKQRRLELKLQAEDKLIKDEEKRLSIMRKEEEKSENSKLKRKKSLNKQKQSVK